MQSSSSPFFLSRRSSRTNYTEDDDQHNRMSDTEECQSNPGSTSHDSFRSRRRSSSCTSIPSSPSSSSYKMSVDSDDGRSISSPSGNGNSNTGSWGKQRIAPLNDSVRRNTHPPTTLFRQWQQDQDLQQQQQQAEISSSTHMNEDHPPKTVMDLSTFYHPSTLEATADQAFIRPTPSTQRLKSTRSSTTLSQSSSLSSSLKSSAVFPSCINHTNTNKKQQQASSTESSHHQKDHPERRTVRRTSLLLKSKALSRVMHQAEEEIHLADLEMRQEQGTTSHLKSRLVNAGSNETHPPPPPPPPPPFSSPPWTTSTLHNNNTHFGSTPSIPIDMSSSSSSSSTSSPMTYQCSKLNPELEMTNFQFENLPSPMQSSFKSIKRKASEDRLLDSYNTSSLKRRAVSPSVSLSGSPILTASSSTITSPPTTSLSSSSITSSPTSSSHVSYFQCSGNAAARTPSQSTQSSSARGFNLHEASGGISRMSLSE